MAATAPENKPLEGVGAPVTPPGRSLIRDGAGAVVRVGLARRWWRDLYHYFLEASWPRVMGILVLVYVTANMVFALGYLACGSGIEGASGGFGDAFFFSVQTWATIGYGRMVPRSAAANALVTVEAFAGILSMAMVTGLLFAKFSRPTARVLFARVAVVTEWNGRPALLFRLANERGNPIVDASIAVVMARQEVTLEGQAQRRNYDLVLVRPRTPFLSLSFTVIHVIDDKSPLRGETARSLAETSSEVLVSLTGLDGTVSQTVHARHSYGADEIVWGARYVDILSRLPDGRLSVDYTRFHDIVRTDMAN